MVGAERGAGRAPGRGPAPAWPGLLAVGAATAVALGVHAVVPALGAATTGVVLGAAAANLGLLRERLRPGAAVASHRLLRAAVVLLGFQLAVPQLAALGFGGLAVVVVTVAVTFTGTLLLGRALGVRPVRALLVATGFSICGASAVAAVKEVTDADEDDTAVAVALVTLCGTLAILVLPALRGPLGLDPVAFGHWVGASVQDVGQTVATAERVPGALTWAVVVKLSRVLLLAPLVAGVALAGWHRGTGGAGTGGAGTGRRPPPVPLFVVGFLAAVAAGSTGWLPAVALDAARTAQEVLLVAALVGLGTGIHLPTLRRTGGRAVLLGVGAWALVAGVSWAGVRLLGA
ncbi:YeiH family protein [Kineococcus arenarius]|uniref:YeiH family protein n=1 Tax=Kineococcus sp. SYSU DK007 TaxID=3383128 RepID=UPI003D7D7677